MDFFVPLVYQILSELPDIDAERLKALQRRFSKEHNLRTLPSKSQLLQAYFSLVDQKKIAKHPDFETLLKKRAIRSLSGIVSVQVLTKPRMCPASCIFCPNDPTMPKSYIKSEPGAMRAFLNQFDPIKQTYNRLQSLTLTGHNPEKIEMIVLGGSRDAYPMDYKTDFIKSLYDACNTFSQLEIRMKNQTSSLLSSEESKYGFDVLNTPEIHFSSSLEEAIENNQTAKHRIIGLTIETRPDLVTHKNCQSRRELGVTRVEMGVQSSDDEILEMNKRGHGIQKVKEAMHLMRQYGFKISLHLMPGLYGSTVAKDIQTFADVFSDPYFKPDELKVYPTSVIPDTELYTLYQQGKYTPITSEEILQIIREIFQHIIPPYTRIKRLIRDIPATEIAAGSSITNLSQLAHTSLLKEYREALDVPLMKGGSEAGDSRHRLDSSLRSEGQTVEEQGDKLDCHAFGSQGQKVEMNNLSFGKSEAIEESRSDKLDFSLRSEGLSRKQEVEHFYTRLYGKYQLFSAEEFSDFSLPNTPSSSETQTFIFGEKPDLKGFRHFVSLDTRSREVRNKKEQTKYLNLVIRKYQSSVGQEYFISYEDELGYLYGFTRLLLPSAEHILEYPGLGAATAIIRELHVYGELQKIGEKSNSATQHSGLGKKLLQVAEHLAKKADFSHISVISGVGVRAYYFKHGYALEGTYVKKVLL